MTAQPSISNARLIYTAARKLADEQARQGYLDSVCGNDVALRHQVEALLAANERGNDNPLEQAAHAALREVECNPDGDRATETFVEGPNGGTADPNLDVRPSGLLDLTRQPQIGPYRVRELLGEGGMGFVYVAEQTRPVQRKVALKVIKPGMDTRDVIARFEAERQALAMMSHPNIAKVLDGGTTDEGRPYFVMELVRGVPITLFCDEQKLSTRERLQLFLPVCQAVQHAHMKGIIHRDLKPSNVIVEMDDVRPIPKVIDFGVAKATGQRLSEQTVYTQFAQLVGTPMYMSPEQAKQSSTDIDTRSDIYSLGVLLYELLTGTTPFDKESLSSVDATELRRMICEDDPPRPSARISTLQNEQLSTITACHRTPPRELSLTLQRELDWIVMKALEKDRTRRYDSASALAGDIQRYLAGDAVQACPPTWGYRLKKFTTRHKGLLTTAALLLGMLATSTIVSATFAVQAGESRDAAEASADEADEQKEAAIAARQLADDRLVREQQARREAEDERQRSQQNYLQARQAVDQMLTHVADEHLSQFPEMAEIRRRLLTDAASFYTQLLTRNPRDAQTFASRGHVYEMLQDYDKVRHDYEQAVEYDPENAEYHFALGSFLTNCRAVQFRDRESALLHLGWACRIDPIAWKYRFTLAGHRLWRDSDRQAAIQEYHKAAELTEQSDEKAHCLLMAAHAAQDHERVIELAEQINPESRLAQHAYHRGAEAHLARRDFEQVVAAESRAIAASRRHQADTSNPFAEQMYATRARAYLELGLFDQALADCETSLTLAPYRPEVQKLQARVLFELERYSESLALIREFLGSHPKAMALDWISIEQVAGCPDDSFRSGMLELVDESVKTDDLPHRRLGRAELLAATGEFEQALVDFDKAVEMQPENPVWRSCRLRFFVRNEQWQNVQHDVAEGLQHVKDNVRFGHQLAVAALASGDDAAYRQVCRQLLTKWSAHGNQGGDARLIGWTCALAPLAIDDYAPVIKRLQTAVKRQPRSVPQLTSLGGILMRAGDLQAASETLKQAVQEGGTSPTTGDIHYLLAMVQYHLGEADAAQEQLQTANALAERELMGAVSWDRQLVLRRLCDEAEERFRPNQDGPSY